MRCGALGDLRPRASLPSRSTASSFPESAGGHRGGPGHGSGAPRRSEPACRCPEHALNRTAPGGERAQRERAALAQALEHRRRGMAEPRGAADRNAGDPGNGSREERPRGGRGAPVVADLEEIARAEAGGEKTRLDSDTAIRHQEGAAARMRDLEDDRISVRIVDQRQARATDTRPWSPLPGSCSRAGSEGRGPFARARVPRAFREVTPRAYRGSAALRPATCGALRGAPRRGPRGRA